MEYPRLPLLSLYITYPFSTWAECMNKGPGAPRDLLSYSTLNKRVREYKDPSKIQWKWKRTSFSRQRDADAKTAFLLYVCSVYSRSRPVINNPYPDFP